jgi:hypothetical protein
MHPDLGGFPSGKPPPCGNSPLKNRACGAIWSFSFKLKKIAPPARFLFFLSRPLKRQFF